MEKSLKELAALIGAELAGDGSTLISGVAAIETAHAGQITFIANPKYLGKGETTGASAIICSPEIAIAGKPLLKIKNPYLAYAKIVGLFHPRKQEAGTIDARAIVGRDVRIGRDVTLYPFAVIGDGCVLEDGVTIYPHCFLGNNVTVGEQTLIYPSVTIREHCIIGKRVIIHPGTVIGSDGFGFAKDGASYYKIPQVGIVQIDDDVEIGACNTIDRAAMGRTWIQRGVKTDNMVHIAHNVTVGEDSILVAQVGVSGSTTIGKRVTLAGQVGVVGHITIGDDTIAGAKTGISGNVEARQIVSGYPHMPHRDWLKASRTMHKLPEMRMTIKTLEDRVTQLEAMLQEFKRGG
jgi:UDP-3-O-[3-hydroxymyristoyl] glucosamine N-acyltransferase